MNLDFDPRYDRLRAEAEAFCRTSWPPGEAERDLPHRQQVINWQKRALAAGLLHRTAPTMYGGAGAAHDVFADAVILAAFTASGVPHLESTPNGPRFLVPALLEFGAEQQKSRYIPGTLNGELNWCQGYSEPGAGSDLAAIRSTATLDGDVWVINGQKLWTSNAHRTNMMFGLFRTEPEQARGGGVSLLLLEMNTPGLQVRPLRTMHGAHDFCEVFFDDVRVPAGNLVGPRGGGWTVSKAVLKHERFYLTDSSVVAGQFQRLVELARRTSREGRAALTHPDVQQRLVEIEGWVECLRYAGARMLTAMGRGDEARIAGDLLMGKLLTTRTLDSISRLAVDLLGEDAVRAPEASDLTTHQQLPAEVSDSRWVNAYFATLGYAMGGGTSNIQRNIIGERWLGLPRDLTRARR